MPTVTVYFGGICTFFLSQHHSELNGFCRAVLVNAAGGRIVAGHDIPAHVAEVQIGDGERVTVHGVRMRLLTSSDDPVHHREFDEFCPDLTLMVAAQGSALSDPSPEVVFDGDPAAASLYFDFKSGTLEAGKNHLHAVVTRLVMKGDQVALETVAFNGAPEPPPFPPRIVFDKDTTILVSNDDLIENTSMFDFYLHYLTAKHVPFNPPIPDEACRRRLPVIPHLPHRYGAIGAGCSNSTYP